MGRSQVVDPDGAVRQEGSLTNAETLVADIDLTEADRKNLVVRAGEHEMNCIADRRPDLYGSLLAQREPSQSHSICR